MHFLRLHIKANDGVHDVIPLNFLTHLSTLCIYHNYEDLVQNVYPVNSKQQAQMVVKLKQEHLQKSQQTPLVINLIKLSKMSKQSKLRRKIHPLKRESQDSNS